MVYDLTCNETAGQFVEIAGGYARDAYLVAVVISRQGMDRNLPTVLNMNLVAQGQSTLMRNGGTLRVR